MEGSGSVYKVLIVDDERELVEGIEMNLRSEGYIILKAFDGETAVRIAVEESPHVIVLDFMLPGIGGLDVIRELKRLGVHSRIIVLSALKDVMDRIIGIEVGADDYLPKPFSMRERQARVRARLRFRNQEPSETILQYRFDNCEIDFGKYTAIKNGQAVDLTAKEFEVLRFLVQNRGQVVSRDTLLDKVWGYEAYPTTRTVDNHILKLRKKLERNPSKPRYLLSIYGGGYTFVG